MFHTDTEKNIDMFAIFDSLDVGIFSPKKKLVPVISYSKGIATEKDLVSSEESYKNVVILSNKLNEKLTFVDSQAKTTKIKSNGNEQLISNVSVIENEDQLVDHDDDSDFPYILRESLDKICDTAFSKLSKCNLENSCILLNLKNHYSHCVIKNLDVVLSIETVKHLSELIKTLSELLKNYSDNVLIKHPILGDKLKVSDFANSNALQKFNAPAFWLLKLISEEVISNLPNETAKNEIHFDDCRNDAKLHKCKQKTIELSFRNINVTLATRRPVYVGEYCMYKKQDLIDNCGKNYKMTNEFNVLTLCELKKFFAAQKLNKVIMIPIKTLLVDVTIPKLDFEMQSVTEKLTTVPENSCFKYDFFDVQEEDIFLVRDKFFF